MHKSLIALAAATSLGFATMAVPSTADARCVGCAVGAGVLGGIVAGAIVGSAIANSPPPPPPPPGYYPPPPPPPYAVAPGPAYAELPPGCHLAKRKVWVENVGYRIRTVQICH